jgi:hypothetical protein
MDALDAVREFRTRVVVATDLIARGVDLGAPRAGSDDLLVEHCGRLEHCCGMTSPWYQGASIWFLP